MPVNGKYERATNFDDISIKEPRTWNCDDPDLLVKCPVCKGHGFWNYSSTVYRDGSRMQSACSQCNTWGWVKKGSIDETCIHEYREIFYKDAVAKGYEHWGMFCHVYECRKCGNVVSHDSSG